MSTSAPVECQFYPNFQAQEKQPYLISPLDIYDVSAINLQIRANLIRAARVALEGCDNAAEADQVLEAAMRQAAQMSLLGGGYSQYFGSLDGASLVLYQSLHKCNDKITLDDVYSITSDDRNSEEIKDAFLIIRRRKEVNKKSENPTNTGDQNITNS